MTLALYGKSKKRQGGLLFTAFMAIMVAAIAGVALIGTAFAHHLESSVKTPTCQDQSWNVNVVEGSWSSYREAVLTVTDGTTPVAMRFTPFLDNGGSNSTILTASGTGTVHTSGNVKQYTGAFSDGEDNSTNINDSTTSLVHSSNVAWESDWTVGQVFIWDSELMKITARSGDGKTLTVERGFGDTAAASHTSNSQGRWVRGSLEGSPNTVSWDLDFDYHKLQPRTITVIDQHAGHQLTIVSSAIFITVTSTAQAIVKTASGDGSYRVQHELQCTAPPFSSA